MSASKVKVVILIIALLGTNTMIFAHGGEDHGDKPAAVVATGPGMQTRTARAGDFEVMLKSLPIIPDKELTARIFVTRYATNEPVQGAQIAVTIGDGGTIPEIIATAGSTPGAYEIKLPPLPQGDYKLQARVTVKGDTQTAQYGVVKVAPPPPPPIESSTTWARRILVGLALLLGLGVIGILGYRLFGGVRRSRVKGEAVTA